jgi:fructokinase
VASLDASGSAHYDFRLDDAADWRWRDGELPDALPDGVRALHTGSIAALRPPGSAAVEELLRREHERGAVTISFDPNARPAVVGDHDEARATARRIAALAHIVKASDEDLAFLDGDRPTLEAARALAGAGPSLVVVTRGGEGAVALRADGTEVAVAAPVVDVVDTVGAGDSFMGALLHRLDAEGFLGSGPRDRLARLDEEALRRVLRFACQAAAHTITRVGADPPTAPEVEAALREA